MNLDELIKVLEKLVSFNTVSDQSTIDITSYISNYLISNGFNVELIGNEKHQNIIAKNNTALECDKIGKKYFGFCGHLDTVPPDNTWLTNPFKLKIRDEKIYGLGTSDMKSAVASMITTAIQGDKLGIPVGLVFTHSEETTMAGALELVSPKNLSKLQNMELIIGEGTNFDVGYAHKGIIDFTINIYGKGGHSSKPKEGLNALDGEYILRGRLNDLRDELYIQKNEDFETGSILNLGIIQGGDATNKICDKVSISGSFRYLPGRVDKYFEYKLREYLNEIEKKGYKTEYICLDDSPPFKINPGKEFIQNLIKITNGAPTILPYCTDASIFNGIGNIPCAIIGPNGFETAHKPNEYILKSDLEKLNDVYLRIIKKNIGDL